MSDVSTETDAAAEGAGTPLVLVRYAEIFLKGRNRGQFERQLASNIARALRDLGAFQVEVGHGRIVVHGAAGAAVRERLARVFGISSFSPSLAFPPDLAAVEAHALALGRAAAARGVRSFRIESRRTDKAFPLTSPEVNAKVGARVKEETGMRVDLSEPESVIGIEIATRRVYVYGDVVRGPGGLPVGSGGRALLLLSGGIDSPVAGHLMQKRGVVVSGCYFHSFPYTGDGAREKVLDLARLLAPAQGELAVNVVPFTAIQERLRDVAPPTLLVILYRRMMMRIAERIARKENARVLVTGENVGQVASQTLESLDCIERATAMPVLRPLVCYDKIETIAIARDIGTYPVSIRPFDDCCSLFVPKHPEIRPNLMTIERAERGIEVEAWADEAAAATERHLLP